LASISYECPESSPDCDSYISDLAPNTSYSFIVRADEISLNNSTNPPTYASCDGGVNLNVENDWCPAEVATLIESPSTPEVTRAGCGKLSISWDGISEAESYIIKRSIVEIGNAYYATITSNGSEFFSSASLGCSAGGVCSYTDPGIIPEVLYFYKISGLDAESNMTPWTSASAGAWSYCYRSNPWQER